MSRRDIYYRSLANYHNLHEWQQLIKDGEIGAAIAYWKAKGLRTGQNTYVMLKPDSWVSPLYFCCLSAQNGAMVKLLLSRGADPDQIPDSETADCLPFICHSLYLKTLGDRHKGGPFRRCDMLDRSICHRLSNGDSTRLVYLINLGLLDKETIEGYILEHSDIILEKIQTMIKYLTYCYNVRAQQSTLDLTEETEKTIRKFCNVTEFLIKYGAPVTEQAVQICICHYLYEILPILQTRYPVSVEPQYHTQMDGCYVAMVRPLLNDKRYVLTCKVTGHEPDPEVYNYDIST